MMKIVNYIYHLIFRDTMELFRNDDKTAPIYQNKMTDFLEETGLL